MGFKVGWVRLGFAVGLDWWSERIVGGGRVGKGSGGVKGEEVGMWVVGGCVVMVGWWVLSDRKAWG